MSDLKFSRDFKNSLIQKYYARGDRTVEEICKEVGATSKSLYNWLRSTSKDGSVNQKKEKSPQDRTTEEKVQFVIAYFALDESERGGWLRQHGVSSHHLEKWREQMTRGFDRKQDKEERFQDKKTIKELERQIRRKDKALAEAAALIILKKKVDAIWGDREDD